MESNKLQTLVQMWELLICPICKDLFNEPKILPCVHSFCETCLEGLTRLQKSAFQCPVCRAPTQLPLGGVGDIPHNFFLNSILDIMKRQRNASGDVTCDACSVNVLSTLRCTDCNVLLCTKCLPAHDVGAKGSACGNEEEVTRLGKREAEGGRKQHQLHISLKCEHHPKQDLRFFCSNCAKLVCEDCVVAKHLTHIFVSASDVVPSCKAKLNTLLSQITSKILFLSDAQREIKDTEQHLHARVVEIRNLIGTTKNELFAQQNRISAKLDSEEKSLLNRLDAVARKKFDVLARQRGKLETRLSLIENCRMFTSHLLLNGSDEEILTMENCIMESLGDLCQHTLGLPIECSEDSFVGFRKTSSGERESELVRDVNGGQRCPKLEGGNLVGVIVSGEGCGSCCFATGEGLTSTVVGQDTTFTVTVKNDQNKGCVEGRGSIVARVKTPHDSYFQAGVVEHRSNKHKFRYRTYIAGPHVLKISIRGEEILGSPFEPLSSGSTDYSRRGRLITKFGRAGTGEGELCSPHGLAVDRLSRIFVADTGNHRIQVFNQNGRFLFGFGRKGSEPGEFHEPCDVTINQVGLVLVADKGNNRIQMFTCDGTFVSQLRLQSMRPSAVTTDNYNNMIVVDSDTSRVLVFTMAGEMLRSVSRGLPNGRGLGHVQDVASGQTGEVFLISRVPTDKGGGGGVVEATKRTTNSGLIQVFDKNGDYLREFVIPSYVCPTSSWCRLLTDHDDRVLATGVGNKVQVFTRAGGHLTNITFTEKDYKEIEISAIALTPNGSVLVADVTNGRILMF